MHLINPLASGVVGCENGSARIYQRGTSTRAQTYSDVYGASPNTRTSDTRLDAHGGATCYVNELVDVTAFDSDGNEVRAFSAADESTAIQYAGTAFTGVDPVTGVTAVNKPQLLKRILDLLGTTFGAADGLVPFQGSNRTLASIFAGLGYFYSVKDSAYGAVGDGVTDDTAAVAAASAAAFAAGGGIVFFPAGTYKLSSVHVQGNRVSLLGAGAGATAIEQSNAAVSAISMNGTEECFIRGLTVRHSVSSASILIGAGSGPATIDQCVFGGASTLGTLVDVTNADSGVSSVTLRDCTFLIYGPSQVATTGTDYNVLGGRIQVVTTTHNETLVYASRGTIGDCRFDYSLMTTGTSFGVSSDGCRVHDCEFEAPVSGTVTAIKYLSGTLMESGNVFFGTVVPYNLAAALFTNADKIQLRSREGRVLLVSDNLKTPTLINATAYSSLVVTDTTHTASGTCNLPLQEAPVGTRLAVRIFNDSGAANSYRVRAFTAGLVAKACDPAYTASVADQFNVFWILESQYDENTGKVAWMHTFEAIYEIVP